MGLRAHGPQGMFIPKRKRKAGQRAPNDCFLNSTSGFEHGNTCGKGGAGMDRFYSRASFSQQSGLPKRPGGKTWLRPSCWRSGSGGFGCHGFPATGLLRLGCLGDPDPTRGAANQGNHPLRKHSVQWHQFFLPFFFWGGGCPTKNAFPQKGFPFFPGSLNN